MGYRDFPVSLKSVKVSPEHHRKLKLKAAERGLPLQLYLALLLELVFSDDPELKQPRLAYMAQTEKVRERMIEELRRAFQEAAELDKSNIAEQYPAED